MTTTHLVMNGFFIVTCVAGIALALVAFRRKKNAGLLTICVVFVLELALVYGHYAVTARFLPANHGDMRGIAYVQGVPGAGSGGKVGRRNAVGGYRFRLPLSNILLLVALWQLGWGRKCGNKMPPPV